MHTAALVPLVWAISFKTTREEPPLLREGNIVAEKQAVGIFEVALPNGCSMDEQTIT